MPCLKMGVRFSGNLILVCLALNSSRLMLPVVIPNDISLIFFTL